MSSPTSFNTFPQFENFPLEIRTLIWQQALEDIGSRVIYLYQFPFFSSSTNPTQTWIPPESRLGFKRTTSIPSLLRVCRESHSLASQSYHPAFYTFSHQPEIYFDFSRDILHIDRHSFLNNICPLGRSLADINVSDLRQVQHLSVVSSHIECPTEAEDTLCEILSSFGNVKTVVVTREPNSKFISKLETHAAKDLILRVTDDFDMDPIQEHEDVYLFEEKLHVRKRFLEKRRIKWNARIKRKRDKFHNDNLVVWEMPKIVYKLVMSAKIEEELEMLCAEYAALWPTGRKRNWNGSYTLSDILSSPEHSDGEELQEDSSSDSE